MRHQPRQRSGCSLRSRRIFDKNALAFLSKISIDINIYALSVDCPVKRREKSTDNVTML